MSLLQDLPIVAMLEVALLGKVVQMEVLDAIGDLRMRVQCLVQPQYLDHLAGRLRLGIVALVHPFEHFNRGFKKEQQLGKMAAE